MHMYARAHAFGHAFLLSLYLQRFSLGVWKFQGFAAVEILRLQRTQHTAYLNALHYEAASKEGCKCGLWARYFTEHCVNSCNWNVLFMCFPWNKVPRFMSIQNAGEIVVLWTCKVDLQSCLKWARWLVAERDCYHNFIVILVSVCRSDINLEMFSLYLRWPHHFFCRFLFRI
jgi:hypothetical protein